MPSKKLRKPLDESDGADGKTPRRGRTAGGKPSGDNQSGDRDRSAKDLKDLRKQLDGALKQIKEMRTTGTASASSEDVEMAEDDDKNIKAKANADLKRYEKIKADNEDDDELRNFAVQKIAECKATLTALANKDANPEEVYLNNVKVERKLLQEAQEATNTIVQKLKRTRNDLQALEERKKAIEKEMEEKRTAEADLQEDFAKAKAKLDSFRTVKVPLAADDATHPGVPGACNGGAAANAAAPQLDFAQYVQGADIFLAEADKHLNAEGVQELKKHLAALSSFVQRVPTLLTHCTEAGLNDEDEQFDETELGEATKAAESAIADAKSGADTEAVGRHAFALQLQRTRRTKVQARMSKFVKSKQSSG